MVIKLYTAVVDTCTFLVDYAASTFKGIADIKIFEQLKLSPARAAKKNHFTIFPCYKCSVLVCFVFSLKTLSFKKISLQFIVAFLLFSGIL